jgi:hypothetical protein
MSLFSELLGRQWEGYRQRPFWRLVELFVARIFRGGGDSDTEGLDLGVGLVLTLLAVPGGFVSVLLFDKYGSLLQWLRGQSNVDTLLIAFPDEYFFIVLSMTVTGAVAVWRWDAIFPDRRDYINLVPLPISTKTIFFANLVAGGLLVTLVAFDVNAASCVLFPTVVAAAQPSFAFALRFAGVHAMGVIASSIFAFLSVFSVLGVLMAVLPPRVFRRASTYVRGILVVYLVALLCTSFAIPELLRRIKGPAPWWTLLTPSCWFVSMCQSFRGRGSAAMVELSTIALPAIALLGVIAVAMYAIAYRRHFLGISELAEGSTALQCRKPWRSSFLDGVLLKTPFQKAGFRFVRSTLLRSEPHRLVLTGIIGLALVLASQAFMQGFEATKSPRQALLSPGALSVPFIFSFLLIVGLRVVFEIPVELRANWVFQLLLDAHGQETEQLARRLMLVAVLPAVVAITFISYLCFTDVAVATLHTALVVIWGWLLTNIVLVRFRKLPFTCTLPVFKQHSIVILLSFAFGYLIYAVSVPEFESSALVAPVRMLSLAPLALIAWYVPRHLAKNTIDLEKTLIFEESPVHTIQALRLSE